MYELMSDTLDIMWGNLMEADKYVKMAHELKDDCRMMADWCKDMAAKHMEFNVSGRAVYDRLKDRLHEEHEHAEHHAGIVMVLDRNMAKLNRQHSEIKAMMDMYK
jgi:hypothetical protein